MKKILKGSWLCLMALMMIMSMVACDKYDDTEIRQNLADIEAQVSANKAAIEANKLAISNIQTLISSGSVITDVKATDEGITVTLSNGTKFNINNGADGKNGKDAAVWSIDKDGYWCVDGEKTEYKAVGAEGKYYVPVTDAKDSHFGTFDIYQDGKLVEHTTLKWNAAGLSAVYDSAAQTLTFTGVDDTSGPIVVPLSRVAASGLKILGVDDYNTIEIEKENQPIYVQLPDTEYSALLVTFTSEDGINSTLVTRASSGWTCDVVKPRSGSDIALINITSHPAVGKKAIMKVTCVSAEGAEASSSVILEVVKPKTTEPVKPTDNTPYLTFEADAEQTFRLSVAVPTIEYSVDGGDWAELGTKTVAFGGAKGDLRLRGKSEYGTCASISGANVIFNVDLFPIVKVNCSGDIRTLVDYENYANANTSSAKFTNLFKDAYELVSAPELPATDLADYCYANMFDGCISLVSAPELPATTMADHCYQGMFHDCTSLKSTPALPATSMAESCFACMFDGCSKLTSAADLQATSMAPNCCSEMFKDCKSLVSAPELPATSLADYCYVAMFWGCTSLEKAPELPATSLATGCYSNMFLNCSKLNYVKMMALSASENELGGWLSGVASTGTFVKNKNATWEATGVNGIPEGWTVEKE